MMDLVLFLIIIIMYIMVWVFSPPTPKQLCKKIWKALGEAGDNKEMRKEKVAEMAVLLKKYLFDDAYCRQYRDSFGLLFGVLSKNRDLAEAVFGNFAAVSMREAEIEKLPPLDTGDCGSSCSGYAR